MKGKQTLLSYHHSPQRSWSDAKQTKMTHSPSSPYQNVSLKKQTKTTQSAISQAELQLELNFYKAKCHELEQHSSRGSQNTTIQIQTAQIKELQKENADLKRQLQANKENQLSQYTLRTTSFELVILRQAVLQLENVKDRCQEINKLHQGSIPQPIENNPSPAITIDKIREYYSK